HSCSSTKGRRLSDRRQKRAARVALPRIEYLHGRVRTVALAIGSHSAKRPCNISIAVYGCPSASALRSKKVRQVKAALARADANVGRAIEQGVVQPESLCPE